MQPGEDKLINLWDQLDTFSITGLVQPGDQIALLGLFFRNLRLLKQAIWKISKYSGSKTKLNHFFERRDSQNSYLQDESKQCGSLLPVGPNVHIYSMYATSPKCHHESVSVTRLNGHGKTDTVTQPSAWEI